MRATTLALALVLIASEARGAPLDPVPASAAEGPYGAVSPSRSIDSLWRVLQGDWSSRTGKMGAMQGMPLAPSGEGSGWLARWLTVAGEGVVTVLVSDRASADVAAGVRPARLEEYWVGRLSTLARVW
jgi:hypothetical protein